MWREIYVGLPSPGNLKLSECRNICESSSPHYLSLPLSGLFLVIREDTDCTGEDTSQIFDQELRWAKWTWVALFLYPTTCIHVFFIIKSSCQVTKMLRVPSGDLVTRCHPDIVPEVWGQWGGTTASVVPDGVYFLSTLAPVLELTPSCLQSVRQYLTLQMNDYKGKYDYWQTRENFRQQILPIAQSAPGLLWRV